MNIVINNEEVKSSVETEIATTVKPEIPATIDPETNIVHGAEKDDVKKTIRSAQLSYVLKNKFNPILRKKSYENNSLMYQWSKKANCWTRHYELEGEGHAFKWLSENEPKFANDRTAKSCISCLKYELQEVPPTPDFSIIPLNNVWLKINTETNNIEYVKPSMDYFVDYTINTEIKVNKFKDNYIPKDIPDTSMFKKYIESALPKADVRGLVQEFCGYTLLQGNPFQVAQFWEGAGSNGKSVLMKIMESLHKNHKTMDLDNLQETQLNKLIGTSLVIVPETPEKGIDEQIFKKCVSSDIISVRALYQNSIDYSPFAKWIISCNKFPYIKDTTDGFWRRVQTIQWEQQFLGDDRIYDLDKKIINQELNVVLDWCLQGLMRLLVRGKFDDSCVVAEKEKKKIEGNSALLFIQQTGLELTNANDKDQFQLKKEDIYRKYQEFCNTNGFIFSNSTKFWIAMNAKFRGLAEERRRIGSERKFFVNLRYNLDDTPTPPPSKEVVKQPITATIEPVPQVPVPQVPAPHQVVTRNEQTYDLDGHSYTNLADYMQASVKKQKADLQPTAQEKQFMDNLVYGLKQKVKVGTATEEDLKMLKIMI
jgi:putative DNA primase/helicase